MSDIRERLAAALKTTPMVAATINRMGRPNAVAWQNDADAILAALAADGIVIFSVSDIRDRLERKVWNDTYHAARTALGEKEAMAVADCARIALGAALDVPGTSSPDNPTEPCYLERKEARGA